MRRFFIALILSRVYTYRINSSFKGGVVTNRIYCVIKNGREIKSYVPGKYAGWKTGKIFGRLDCKSGKRMKKENRVFFLTWKDAIASGYRPCKKCKPAPNDKY